MSHKLVEPFYDDIADTYEVRRFTKPYYQKIDRLERSYVMDKVNPGASVLEIGPGTGRFTNLLVEKASTVTAIDVSARMLEQLQQKVGSSRLTVHHLNISDLTSLADYGNYDTLVCMRVMSHLEDPGRAIDVMGRAVKPGGNVVFDLWNQYSFIGLVRKLARRPSRVLTRFYSYRHMLQMIEASNLVVRDKLAWGYPRFGSLSVDRLGNLLLKPFGYSIIFDAVRR